MVVTSLNATTISVTFDEPFSLSGVPILFYTVKVIATDSMDTIRVVNTTMTLVLFDLYDECTQYKFIVSAWNVIGEGVQHVSKNAATLYKGIHSYLHNIEKHIICVNIIYTYLLHSTVPFHPKPESFSKVIIYHESQLVILLHFEVMKYVHGL